MQTDLFSSFSVQCSTEDKKNMQNIIDFISVATAVKVSESDVLRMFLEFSSRKMLEMITSRGFAVESQKLFQLGNRLGYLENVVLYAPPA